MEKIRVEFNKDYFKKGAIISTSEQKYITVSDSKKNFWNWLKKFFGMKYACHYYVKPYEEA